MTTKSVVVSPGPGPRAVRLADGSVQTAPDDWTLVPPGDPGLTRRVKAIGPSWTVQEKKGRKTFSRGVWAPTEAVERLRAELAAERETPRYANRREADARRREAVQTEYVDEFRASVLAYLAFHSTHRDLAERLATVVTEYATPVGSGTVARTKRIPVERRAEAAVVAWMRHQTTAYESMSIPRVKRKRREVRRVLARRSKELLDGYRKEGPVPAGCPLAQALAIQPAVP